MFIFYYLNAINSIIQCLCRKSIDLWLARMVWNAISAIYLNSQNFLTLSENHAFKFQTKCSFLFNFFASYTCKLQWLYTLLIHLFDHKLFDFWYEPTHCLLTLSFSHIYESAGNKFTITIWFVIFGKKILLSKYGHLQRRRRWARFDTLN